MQMAPQRTFRNNRACVHVLVRCVQERTRASLLTVSVEVQKCQRRASDLVRAGSGTTRPGTRGVHGREKPERRLVKPLRGHHVAESARGVLGSSLGPSCNLHSSRNRRPDERNISGSGEREGPRIQRRWTRGPCYFMTVAGSWGTQRLGLVGIFAYFQAAAAGTKNESKFCSQNSSKVHWKFLLSSNRILFFRANFDLINCTNWVAIVSRNTL